MCVGKILPECRIADALTTAAAVPHKLKKWFYLFFVKKIGFYYLFIGFVGFPLGKLVFIVFLLVRVIQF